MNTQAMTAERVQSWREGGVPDEAQIVRSGSITFIREKLGVQVARLEPGELTAVADAEGLSWELLSDGFCVTARRPRTEAERVAYIDAINARQVCDWFSEDRLLMCQMIANEVRAIGQALAERLSPARRKALTQRLERLGTVQWRLTTEQDVDLVRMRAELTTAGIALAQWAGRRSALPRS